MAVPSIRCLALAAVLIAGIVISGNHVSAQTCEPVDFPGLGNSCIEFVKIEGPKIPPSAECCDVLKKVDIPCFCQQLPPGIELIISLEKTIYVAETCGLSVPHGTKCGSFDIPPAAP